MTIRSATLICFLLFTSCGKHVGLPTSHNSATQDAAKYLRDTSKAIGTFQDIVMDAHAKNLFSEPDTRTVLEFTTQLNASGQRAILLVRLMEQTGNKDPKDALAIMDSITGDLAKLAGGLTIKDDKLRQNVLGTLQLAQASLNSAKIALLLRKNP